MRKIITLLMVFCLLAGLTPVSAGQIDTEYIGIPETVAEIKRAIPEASIIEFDESFEALSIVNGELQYNVDSLNPMAVPVETYFREVENGNYTLYVYEDGSYNLITTEHEENNSLTTLLNTIFATRELTYSTFTYTGTSTQRFSFRLDYYTDEDVFYNKDPYNRVVTAWGTYSYQDIDYGLSRDLTEGFLSGECNAIVYDEWQNPHMVPVGTHTLTAKRNGTGRPTSSFSM